MVDLERRRLRDGGVALRVAEHECHSIQQGLTPRPIHLGEAIFAVLDSMGCTRITKAGIEFVTDPHGNVWSFTTPENEGTQTIREVRTGTGSLMSDIPPNGIADHITVTGLGLLLRILDEVIANSADLIRRQEDRDELLARLGVALGVE